MLRTPTKFCDQIRGHMIILKGVLKILFNIATSNTSSCVIWLYISKELFVMRIWLNIDINA